MAESRTQKGLTNIIFNLVNQVITLLLSFISREVFIYTLGVEFLGINGLFSDVLGLLSMADLGFNTAMIYSFYKPIAENNHKKISALVTFYQKVYNIIALTVTVIGIALTPFIPFIVNTEKEIPLIHVYYLFALAGVVVSYMFVYRTSVITANQKNYIISRITILTTFIRTILQIGFLLIYKNFIIYLALGIIFNFLNNIIASYYAQKMYPYIKNKENLEKKEVNEIITNVKSVFIYKVSSVLLTATDNIIISIIIGTVAVGYYSNYLMISNKLILFVSLIFTSLTPGIGNIVATEKPKKRYEVFSIEQTISFVVCGIVCGIVVPCFFVLVEDLIYVWLGKEFVMGYDMAAAVALNMYLACVLQPLWSYREATGLYNKTKWIMVLAVFCNLVLSIILGNVIGVVGVVIASSISRIVTYVWYEPKVLFKEYFEQKTTIYFKGIIRNLLLICLLSSIFLCLSKKIIVLGWFSLIGKAMLFALISFFTMFIMYRKSSAGQWIKSKISSLMEGRKR